MTEQDLYVIQAGECFKIGIAKRPKQRLKELQTGNHEKLKLVRTFSPNSPSKVEGKVHRVLRKYRTTGEWFKCPVDVVIAAIDQVISREDGIRLEKQRKKEIKKLIPKEKRYKIPRPKALSLMERIVGEIRRNTNGRLVTMTDRLLRLVSTKGVGMPSRRARILGIPRPLKHGWRSSIIGAQLPIEAIEDAVTDLMKMHDNEDLCIMLN